MLDVLEVAGLDVILPRLLLPGDAEEQTEERLVGKETSLEANVLKVAHHGSRYATSDNFLKRVFRKDDPQPKSAIISLSEFNRYGHPSQDTLNRLKNAGVTQLFRTDLQGEITITTTGKQKDGKLYDRVWAPGPARTPPVRLRETIETARGTFTADSQAMLYAAPLGLPDPAPRTEYIMVAAVESGGRAWVEISAGIDVSPAMLSLA